MNHWQEHPAASIGAAAYASWTHARSATLVGITSRGFYWRATPDRILFLSDESQRGPLTITLVHPIDRLRDQKKGDSAQFAPNRLFLPAIDIAITISTEIVWQAPNPAAPMRSSAAIEHDLRSIAHALPIDRRGEGFGPMLFLLLDRVSPPEDLAALYERLSALSALCAQHSPQAAARMIDLLGYGRGLTPSGDDVLIGLLLLLNRFPRMTSQVDPWLTELNRQIVHEAYQRTTTLSANLIECAANGQGDERLIAVVDGVATGQPAIEECVDCVLDWGSSSGIDALLGMALAVTDF